MKSLPIRNRYEVINETIVDEDTFEWAKNFSWYLTGKGYVTRSVNRSIKFYLHKEVVGADTDSLVDHVDRNRLNNRRDNLRIVSKGANVQNTNRAIGSSGFRGVYYHAKTVGYQASIMVNQKRLHLGLFKDKEDAAIAYDNAAITHFGEQAQTNKSLGLL